MKIALTGGVGCGKSTVLKYVEQQGFKCFNCDRAINDIMSTNESYDLVYKYEKEVLNYNYSYDPRPYAQLYIYAQLQTFPGLSSIYHSFVNQKITELVLSSDAVVFEVPISFGLDFNMFDQVWVVTCSSETQIKRLTQRYEGDEPYARSVVYSYMPLQNCLTKVDLWINTDCPQENVKAQLAERLNQVFST